MGLIWSLVIGGVAGWLAGQIMKGRGHGVLMNVIIGIIGGAIGGFVFGLLGITTGGMIGQLITATIGAVILIWLASLIARK
jgi:uncharacterized membrane protein YeaQ/YmgE (transglycosylase-associated protein family)